MNVDPINALKRCLDGARLQSLGARC
jgi:hypothetical protein